MGAEQRLHSDSFMVGWGGVDLASRKIVHEFWRGSDEHINVKELIAAMQTVKALATPGKTVELSVDNAVSIGTCERAGAVARSSTPSCGRFGAGCRATKSS